MTGSRNTDGEQSGPSPQPPRRLGAILLIGAAGMAAGGAAWSLLSPGAAVSLAAYSAPFAVLFAMALLENAATRPERRAAARRGMSRAERRAAVLTGALLLALFLAALTLSLWGLLFFGLSEPGLFDLEGFRSSAQ